MRTCILRKRLRALIAAVCMVMFLFGSVSGPAAVCRADADAGADPAGIRCEDGNENCLLLQMVMRGDFASFDAEDVLHQRIYSAVLVKMKAVTEEDLRHYCAEFGRGEDSVREQYDLALSNCLLAEILYKQTCGEEISDAERVLLLFLEAPGENPDGLSRWCREGCGTGNSNVRQNTSEEHKEDSCIVKILEEGELAVWSDESLSVADIYGKPKKMTVQGRMIHVENCLQGEILIIKACRTDNRS